MDDTMEKLVDVVIVGSGEKAGGGTIAFAVPYWELPVSRLHGYIEHMAVQLADECGTGLIRITVQPLNK